MIKSAAAPSMHLRKLLKAVLARHLRLSSAGPGLLFWKQLGRRVLPWLPFISLMYWALGPRDLIRTLPLYDDACELVTGSTWVDQAIRQGKSPWLFPGIFYPGVWRIGSHSGGPILYFLVWPLFRLGGPAFAFNIVLIAAYVAAFAGALRLASLYVPRLPATVVALAYTFGALRWNLASRGDLNIVLASSLLPWMVWAAEGACSTIVGPGERDERSAASSLFPVPRSLGWLAAGGALWAFAIVLSPYFVFIAGALLGLWLLCGGTPGQRRWATRGLVFASIFGLAVLFSSPWLIFSTRETAKIDPLYFAIDQVNISAASLNSLVAPYLFHPWLAALAARIYHGPPWEQGTANFGIVGALAALAGIVLGHRSPARRPAIVTAGVCLVLALGLTLLWDGASVQSGLFSPLDRFLWQFGHALKPSFFVADQPSPPFAAAVPLPGWALAAAVPLIERGRMFVRYALPASLALCMLAGLAMAALRRTWRQLLLGALLVFEIVPPPLSSVPYPPAPHPAFLWLDQNVPASTGIVTMFAAHPSDLILSIRGVTLLAALYTRQPNVSGATSVLPRYTDELNTWLATHEHPFWEPDFAPILRSYGARYILMEMHGGWEQELWQEAAASSVVKRVGCFPPTAGPSPWPWPICILELQPSPLPAVNLVLRDGWSGIEAWGVWNEGTSSLAQWVVPEVQARQLDLSAFPLCLPGRQQSLTVQVNGTVVAAHRWADCQPWTTTLAIPAALEKVGFNNLELHEAYAAHPVDPARQDPRLLSVAVTRLFIH